jgi:hypothetical protein
MTYRMLSALLRPGGRMGRGGVTSPGEQVVVSPAKEDA